MTDPSVKKSILLQKMTKDPVFFLKVIGIPPIVLFCIQQILPLGYIIMFFLGVVSTLLFQLYFFIYGPSADVKNDPKEESPTFNTKDVQLLKHEDTKSWEDPRKLSNEDAVKQEA